MGAALIRWAQHYRWVQQYLGGHSTISGCSTTSGHSTISGCSTISEYSTIGGCSTDGRKFRVVRNSQTSREYWWQAPKARAIGRVAPTSALVNLFSGQLFEKGIRGVFHSGHDRSIS